MHRPSAPEPEVVASALSELSRLVGLPCIWKPITNWTVRHPAFQECHYHHCSAFCIKVKSDPERFKKCAVQERDSLFQDSQSKTEPYLKRCHAGVTEIVVPIFEYGDIAGWLLMGPFREAGSQFSGYAATRKEWTRCPILTKAEIEQKMAVAKVFASGLIGISPRGRNFRPEDARVGKALGYVKEHIGERLLAGTVARYCGLSLSRFTQLFSKQMGLSFTDYVLQERVHLAEKFLADPFRFKADIAEELGFSDQSHFTRAFKKVTGLTPGDYQKWLAACSGVSPERKEHNR